jgi:hypothetical protein
VRLTLLCLMLLVLPGLASATTPSTYGIVCRGDGGACPGGLQCLSDPTEDPAEVPIMRCLARCQKASDCKGHEPDPGCGGRPQACFMGVCT